MLNRNVSHLLDSREIPLDIIKTNQDIYKNNQMKGRLIEWLNIAIGIKQEHFNLPTVQLEVNKIIKSVSRGRGNKDDAVLTEIP